MDILIIEDNDRMRRALSDLVRLAFPRAVVGEAACGRDAIAACRRAAPRVAMVDIELPDANGIELAASIRAEWPGCAIVIVSSHPASLYRISTERAGVAGYVEKSDVLDRLVPVLSRWLGEPAGAPA